LYPHEAVTGSSCSAMTKHYPTSTSAAAAVWAIGTSSLSLLCFSFTLLCKLYPHGCLPIFWLLTLQKLNFSSLNSNNNWLKLTSAHLTQYTLLIILASFLMNILLLSDQISAFFKSCYSHFCQLCCIRPNLDLKTVIGTSNVHSKLDYYNSLYYEYEYDLTEYGNVFNSSEIL